MPTKQITYQKLQAGNAKAALYITTTLKKDKAISERKFAELYAEANGIRPYCHGSFSNLMETTKNFLTQHGVMNFTQINGLNLYVATQKCVHSKLVNMFIEYQFVGNEDIDDAIAWQKTNKGMVPPKIEGKVIATSILGLTGKAVEIFIKNYEFHLEGLTEINRDVQTEPKLKPGHPRYEELMHTSGSHKRIDIKHAILGPIRDMKEIKKY